MRRIALTLVAALAGLAAAWGASAQPPDGVEVPDRCPRFISHEALPVVRASLPLLAQNDAPVRITFVGHATFLIESPGGIRIATDYNDSVRPAATPDIATMNRAHSTHFSRNPDPGISHLLPGWGEHGEPARHDLAIGDVWVRNVTTNIRGGMGTTQRDQNSIFLFEVAGLCIAHLGHLHHRLTDGHLDALGRVDVVLAPVDGSYTLGTEAMIEVIHALRAPLVVPMHFFTAATLERFLAGMRGAFDIVRAPEPTVTLSRADLPTRPTVLVLPGR